VTNIDATQPAEQPQPVVDRNHHHIASPGQHSASGPRRRASADQERAAMQPDKHWPPGMVTCGRPDVEREAVFAETELAVACAAHDVLRLHGPWTECGRVVHTRRRLSLLRRCEAQMSERRLDVRDASEHEETLGHGAHDLATAGMDYWRGG